MGALLLEAPLARTTPGHKPELVAANSPPIQLLCLAAAAEAAGASVEFVPAKPEWSLLFEPAPAPREMVERLLGHNSDVIFLSTNPLNWPLVARLLDEMVSAPSGGRRPRTVVALPDAVGSSDAILDRYPVDAIIRGGEEDSVSLLLARFSEGERSVPRSALHARGTCLLSAVSQLANWPRWDTGLATGELYGFPLDSQPHPWNMPVQCGPESADVENWLDQMLVALHTLREPQVWLSPAPGTLGQGLLAALGELAYKSIKEYGKGPIFAVRTTPDELMASSVLPNLSVLNVRRIDLLVGAASNSALRRYTDQFTIEQVKQCAREIKEVGLGAKTRLLFVLGLPGEDMAEAMETINFSSTLAVQNSIQEIKFEWWYNIPGSPLYRETGLWQETIAAPQTIWLTDDAVLERVPASLTAEDRGVLVKSIELSRALNTKLTLLGPSLL